MDTNPAVAKLLSAKGMHAKETESCLYSLRKRLMLACSRQRAVSGFNMFIKREFRNIF